MKKTIFDRLEKYLKSGKSRFLPEIRYFDGKDRFSDVNGNWAAKTLEESLDLFLTQYGY